MHCEIKTFLFQCASHSTCLHYTSFAILRIKDWGGRWRRQTMHTTLLGGKTGLIPEIWAGQPSQPKSVLTLIHHHQTAGQSYLNDCISKEVESYPPLHVWPGVCTCVHVHTSHCFPSFFWALGTGKASHTSISRTQDDTSQVQSPPGTY